ncbi:MAG: sigma factor for late transcription [Proteobacteria bacterium]|nr:sigma factor for late transcription [Pseudomonadota bacterium]
MVSKKKKKTTNNYIDNEEFFKAMCEWKILVNEANELGESVPPVTDYIGECFYKISEHLSYRPNFINYPFRDEMVGDGIENCLMYCHNFNPEKSKNPFSYFTQIIYYAFLRRIQKEKKQNYIKYKLAEANDINGNIPRWYSDTYADHKDCAMKNPYADMFGLSRCDIEKFSPKPKKKKNQQKEIDNILQDEPTSEDSTYK